MFFVLGCPENPRKQNLLLPPLAGGEVSQIILDNTPSLLCFCGPGGGERFKLKGGGGKEELKDNNNFGLHTLV